MRYTSRLPLLKKTRIYHFSYTIVINCTQITSWFDILGVLWSSLSTRTAHL